MSFLSSRYAKLHLACGWLDTLAICSDSYSGSHGSGHLLQGCSALLPLLESCQVHKLSCMGRCYQPMGASSGRMAKVCDEVDVSKSHLKLDTFLTFSTHSIGRAQLSMCPLMTYLTRVHSNVPPLHTHRRLPQRLVMFVLPCDIYCSPSPPKQFGPSQRAAR